MVDLIITDSNHVDARSAADFTLDCAWGKEENDFELVMSGASTIDAGAYIYVDGSECGGVVDAMEDHLLGAHMAWHAGGQDFGAGQGQGLPHRFRHGEFGHRLAHQSCGVGCRVRGGGFANCRRADHQKLPVRPLHGLLHGSAEDVRRVWPQAAARLRFREGPRLGRTGSP